MLHKGVLSLGVLHWKGQASEHSTYVQDNQRPRGNRDSIFKGHTHHLTLSPSTELIIWKGPGSNPLSDLGEPLEEAGDNWDFQFTKLQDTKLIYRNMLPFYTLTMNYKREIKTKIPFTIASKRIKYLGINLIKDIKTCPWKTRHWLKKLKLTQTNGKL